MTRAFIEKVLKNRTVDTKKYRYIVKEGEIWTGHAWRRYREIWRLPLAFLGTTAAYTEWEYVWKELD